MWPCPLAKQRVKRVSKPDRNGNGERKLSRRNFGTHVWDAALSFVEVDNFRLRRYDRLHNLVSQSQAEDEESFDMLIPFSSSKVVICAHSLLSSGTSVNP